MNGCLNLTVPNHAFLTGRERPGDEEPVDEEPGDEEPGDEENDEDDPMRYAMIVAMGRNRVIGIDNVMPWHIPEDLRYFKAKTLGKPVIMGRKTLESIGKPLPGRPNIVVSREKRLGQSGVIAVATLDEALVAAEAEAARIGADEVMIVGGGQIYRQLIDKADRLYLTEIDLAPEGHAFFPDYEAVGTWRETSREHHPASAGQPAFDFVVKERVEREPGHE